LNTQLKIIIKNYGIQHQKLKAIEELTELSQAIVKDLLKEDVIDNIIEEIADVYVMLEQLKIIYNIKEQKINNIASQKIERTLKKIKEKNES